ncbi:UNVERIFIED_ORG: hypothetical protein ABIC62_006695 [Burkholderia sp. 1595]|uniref:Uncharacterized protein n=1 Tax=Paraburkholderia terricola TaxID=169427 RepID=A0ABU1M2L7_9BURK|nr:hypothetical protein [Paraburkholderia terricola]
MRSSASLVIGDARTAADHVAFDVRHARCFANLTAQVQIRITGKGVCLQQTGEVGKVTLRMRRKGSPRAQIPNNQLLCPESAAQ